MKRKITYFVLLVVAAFAAAAWADTVGMPNGDRLSGTFVGTDGELLVFRTAYGGDLKVKRDAVEYLTTDGAVKVTLSSGKALEGRLEWRDDAQFVVAGDVATPFDITEVTAIAVPGATPPAASPTSPASVPTADANVTPAKEAAADPKKDKGPWSGSVEAGSSLHTGQTDTVEGHLGLSLVRKTEGNTLTLNSNAAYGEVDSEVNTRRAKGEAKWQIYPHEGMYYYVLGGVEHDAARKLDVRGNTAGGLGYDFVKTDRRKLSGDVGIDYAREYWNPYAIDGKEKAQSAARAAASASAVAYLDRLKANPSLAAPGTVDALAKVAKDFRAVTDEPDETVKDNVGLRMSGLFEQTVFEKSKISNNVVYTPQFENFGDYRVTNDLAFTTPLRQGLSLKLNLKTDLDGDISSKGVDAIDNTLLSTLRFEF